MGEYPLIGLEEALDRYRSASAGAGMAGPAQAEVVELTAVELVLEAVQPFCPGDTVYLVPTFAFDPDGVVVVPAVAGEELVGPDQPAEPTPAPCRGNEAVTVPPAGLPEPAPQPWTAEP
ncbi:MAG: hypothetical protein KY439_02660 [Actinobacteria bacterium]|nr:hypothetical protein [Actinomycetota bacterium]